MERKDLSNLIGLNYKFLGTDYVTGVDCIGLCQLFYQLHGYNIEFRDGNPISKDWYKSYPTRMARWFLKKCYRIRNMTDLQYGDIVFFQILGESHTGIYVGYGRVLTILETFKKSFIVKMRENYLFRCGFRFREEMLNNGNI